MLGLLGPDEVIGLLRQRIELLEEQQARQREALEGYRCSVLRLFLLEREYDLAVRETELAWTRGLLEELTDGSFPDLEGWRAYHRSNGASP